MLISSLITAIIFLLIQATTVFAQGVQEWGSINGACVGGPEGDVATIQGIICLIANVLSVTITLIGITAFVMFVFASFKWMMAGTNSKNVESARNTIVYAVAGLVLALSSFIILNIIQSFTGVNVTTLVLPSG
jgi:hypothetical protein